MNGNQIYYKVLDKYMKSPYQEMKYELNRIYTTEGEIEICHNGFHACEELWQVIVWTGDFRLNECRVFKCYLGDRVENNGLKVCSNSIALIGEIDLNETIESIKKNLKKLISCSYSIRIRLVREGLCLDKLVDDNDYDVRVEVARQGFGLDKLIDDENHIVRAEVARQGFRFDKLVNDEDYNVRVEVARQGFGLDKLVNDKEWSVRLEVARQGYGLDKLVSDKDSDVRLEVAKQGYRLDKLIEDKDWHVRKEVVRQGYGLDKLVNDEDWYIRQIAEQKIAEIKNKNV